MQNIVWPEPSTEHLTARVSADTPQNARGRVLAALDGEAFTIEHVRPEDANWLDEL
jgi:hypothetical protein